MLVETPQFKTLQFKTLQLEEVLNMKDIDFSVRSSGRADTNNYDVTALFLEKLENKTLQVEQARRLAEEERRLVRELTETLRTENEQIKMTRRPQQGPGEDTETFLLDKIDQLNLDFEAAQDTIKELRVSLQEAKSQNTTLSPSVKEKLLKTFREHSNRQLACLLIKDIAYLK